MQVHSCTSCTWRLGGGEALGRCAPVSGWLPASRVTACVTCAVLHACIHSGSTHCIQLHLFGHRSDNRWAVHPLPAAGWLSRQYLPHCTLERLGCGAIEASCCYEVARSNIRCLCKRVLFSSLLGYLGCHAHQLSAGKTPLPAVPAARRLHSCWDQISVAGNCVQLVTWRAMTVPGAPSTMSGTPPCCCAVAGDAGGRAAGPAAAAAGASAAGAAIGDSARSRRRWHAAPWNAHVAATGHAASADHAPVAAGAGPDPGLCH